MNIVSSNRPSIYIQEKSEVVIDVGKIQEGYDVA
jgi:hypothetical protein